MRSKEIANMLDKPLCSEPVLRITASLPFKSALSLVDVRVLDHMVVSGSTCTSFAERGLL
jgi:DNA repair protein RadC